MRVDRRSVFTGSVGQDAEDVVLPEQMELLPASSSQQPEPCRRGRLGWQRAGLGEGTHPSRVRFWPPYSGSRTLSPTSTAANHRPQV